MVITNEMMKKKLEGYSNKNNKISREMAKGNLVKIKNGLYETNPNVSGYVLASSVYGPSYLSFEFALYYYGLISEQVDTYTCATFGKKKKKKFDTFFGTYTYRDVPESAYSIGVHKVKEKKYVYYIASMEKALCDELYTLKPIRSMTEIERLILVDLQIDVENLRRLNLKDVKEISDVYHATNVSMLYKFLKKIQKENV